MDEKLKNEWIDMIIDEEEELTTEELYSLINPNNKKEYFDLVDNIVRRHSYEKDMSAEGFEKVFTQEYRRKFKTTAIKYFIEHEKENSSYINTFPFPYPINIPDTTPWNPSYPVYPVQPVTTPWNPGVFYCTTTSTN